MDKHTGPPQPKTPANEILLRAVGALMRVGGTMSLQEQLGALGLIATANEQRLNQRLWEAHHRKYAYTPQTAADVWPAGGVMLSRNATLLRREPRETKRYNCALLRSLRAQRGVGRVHKPDTQLRTKMKLPWSHHYLDPEYIVAYDIVRKDDGSIERFDNIKLYRHTPKRPRRARSLERDMTDEQWLALVKHLTRKVLS